LGGKPEESLPSKDEDTEVSHGIAPDRIARHELVLSRALSEMINVTETIRESSERMRNEKNNNLTIVKRRDDRALAVSLPSEPREGASPRLPAYMRGTHPLND
jgi:hypothetical protein